nr:hypothetical protein [Tanacetum cinerariifolium]
MSFLRSRCLSRHWNRLISDPYSMKSRSRHLIFPPIPLHDLDDNVPFDNTDLSMINLLSSFETLRKKEATIVGSFNGVVLMVIKDCRNSMDMVLYNPFTRVLRILPFPLPARSPSYKFVYGFGYGKNPNDLKIFRCRKCDVTYDVFSLKARSWSCSQDLDPLVEFKDDVGTFINGFLYWFADNFEKIVIVSLDFEKMVFSQMPLPCSYKSSSLGTQRGCLCMTTKSDSGTGFDVWSMKEQEVENIWSKTFTIRLDHFYVRKFKPTSILDDGRIFMTNGQCGLLIYDKSEDTYKTWIVMNGFEDLASIRCAEYVESLISPFNICYAVS